MEKQCENILYFSPKTEVKSERKNGFPSSLEFMQGRENGEVIATHLYKFLLLTQFFFLNSSVNFLLEIPLPICVFHMYQYTYFIPSPVSVIMKSELTYIHMYTRREKPLCITNIEQQLILT